MKKKHYNAKLNRRVAPEEINTPFAKISASPSASSSPWLGAVIFLVAAYIFGVVIFGEYQPVTLTN